MKRSLLFALIAVLFVAAAGFSRPLVQQGQLAELRGTVTDALSGAKLPGVTITATNSETGTTAVSLTVSNGVYRFPAIAPGKYRLTADFPGYRKQIYASVTLDSSQRAQLNVVLQLSSDAASSPVTVEAPPVLQNLEEQATSDAVPAASPRSIRVGASVMEANIINQVPPIYPLEARRAGIKGAVILEAQIRSDGSVGEIRVITGHPLLIQSAIDAVKRRNYKPTVLQGAAVDVVTTITVNVPE